jgi:hypothetical protein
MNILEQMQAVDRLVRRPGGLSDAIAAAVAGGDPLAPVLKTIDPKRLAAVAEDQALLTLARWWQPRFPGVLESATAILKPAELALALVGSPWFEQADGEDRRGTAFARGILDLIAAGRLEGSPWIEELLAYEYLLAVGLPNRALKQPLDEALEERLLSTRTRWFQGGRLLRPVVSLAVRWPVGAWHEGLVDDSDDPQARVHVLAALDDEVAEVEAPREAQEALAMLAAGASDKDLAQKLGKKATASIVGWMVDAEMLARAAPPAGEGRHRKRKKKR